MTLVARAVVAADGLVIDTDTKLTESEARAHWAAGVRVILRYVNHGPASPGDLDRVEFLMLTGIGFTVLIVQHPRAPSNNVLSDQTGRDDAMWAVQNALACGYDPTRVLVPTGCKPPHLALDMEGVRNPGPGSVAHASSWCTRMAFAGFGTLGYNGYDCGLTSADCDALPSSPLFWLDACAMPIGGPHDLRPLPKKGYVLHQQPESVLCGVHVDVNRVLEDGVLFGIADADVNTLAPDPARLPTIPAPPGA